eukprot:10951469-Ditylum_brightwellii.AAC.1
MKRGDVPMDKQVNGKVKTILLIWSFKRKRYPSGLLLKHKTRLCAYGCMQQWGINFWETYIPVVNLFAAELDIDVFMELSIGINVPEGNPKEYILKLNCSIYGLKQSGLNWFSLLPNALMKKGSDFTPSQTDSLC